MPETKGLGDCWEGWRGGYQGPPMDLQRRQPPDHDISIAATAAAPLAPDTQKLVTQHWAKATLLLLFPLLREVMEI